MPPPHLRGQPAARAPRRCRSSCRRSPTSPPSTAARRCSPAWPSSGPRWPRSSARAEPADLREHRRGAGALRAAAVPRRRRCSATSPRRSPRRGCGRSSGRSRRWRPRTPTRSGSTRRCSPASTPCTRRATTPGSTPRRCGWSSATTWTSCWPARGSTRPAGRGSPSSTRSSPTLSTTFGQNLQLATEAAAVRVADAAELDGLDAEEIAAAAGRGRRARASTAT